MKIAIEIQEDGEFCGKCKFGDRWSLIKIYHVCTMFRTGDGRARRLRMNKTKPIRCQQCIDAEIGEK